MSRIDSFTGENKNKNKTPLKGFVTVFFGGVLKEKTKLK